MIPNIFRSGPRLPWPIHWLARWPVPWSVAGIATAVVLAAALVAALVLPNTPPDPNWSVYKDRFIVDGRVVDDANGGVSHSEGQGFGMLLAVAHDDRATFEALWQWTQVNLAVRDDLLHAWRWDPAAAEPVADVNNATDGDLLIAWALTRAGERWRRPAYTRAAAGLAAEIRGRLLRRVDGSTVLLPGAYGFEHPARTIVNPSYFVLPAYTALDRVDPSPDWQALSAASLAVLDAARFGDQGLPPDWLELDAVAGATNARPADGFAPRYGFDAVRVPLYLVWSGVGGTALDPYRAFWAAYDDAAFVPAWLDLNTGEAAPYAMSQGVAAIADLVRGLDATAPPSLPDLAPGEPYYSASLLLLARLAQRELLASVEPAS